MNDTVMVAIISGICVALPSILATVMVNNKNNIIVQYKIETLTKQVEKHNGVIERMAVAESSIKSAHHRIDGLVEK